MERIRSRFLVHWTGKDLDENTAEGRAKCVERLVRTLETGLWLTPCREILSGGTGLYELIVPMTCFTEIRLSVARSHASRYGRLGFCYDRQFILRSGGSPVVYTEPSRNNLLMQRIAGVLGRLDGLETFLTADGGDHERLYAVRDVTEARDLMFQLCSFVKIMSPPNGEQFQYLEEAEWRVAYHEAWARDFDQPRVPAFIPNAARALGETWKRPSNIVPNGDKRPPFFLRFEPSELRMLIVPSDEIRTEALKDPQFIDWMVGRGVTMPMLTLDECEQF